MKSSCGEVEQVATLLCRVCGKAFVDAINAYKLVYDNGT
jgi:hypothetical protein